MTVDIIWTEADSFKYDLSVILDATHKRAIDPRYQLFETEYDEMLKYFIEKYEPKN